MILIFEIFGYIGGAILAISLTPQLYKIFKEKSTKDLSIIWIIVYLSGLICVFVYGLGLYLSNISSFLPVVISLTVEIFIGFIMLITLILVRLNILKWNQDDINLTSQQNYTLSSVT